MLPMTRPCCHDISNFPRHIFGRSRVISPSLLSTVQTQMPQEGFRHTPPQLPQSSSGCLRAAEAHRHLHQDFQLHLDVLSACFLCLHCQRQLILHGKLNIGRFLPLCMTSNITDKPLCNARASSHNSGMYSYAACYVQKRIAD